MNELTKHVEQNLLQYLGKYKNQIQDILSKQVDPQRFAKLIVGAINKTPELLQCKPISVINAVITAASMGVEIRANSAYLIPFGKECTLMIDYRAKIDLARRSGIVTDIDAEVFYAADHFVYTKGSKGNVLEWTPLMFVESEGKKRKATKDERGECLGAFAIAWFKDAPPHFLIMTHEEIEHVRRKAKSQNSPAWRDDWAEMAKKTAVHRICKYLPQSREMSIADSVDTSAEMDMPLDRIITVEPEDEKDAPILPQSAEAAQEVGESRLAELRKQEAELLAKRKAEFQQAVAAVPTIAEPEPSDAAELSEEEMARQQAEQDAQQAQAPRPRRAMTLPGRKP